MTDVAHFTVVGMANGIPVVKPDREVNLTRVDIDRLEIRFDRPYFCKAGKAYAVRYVEGKPQLWEADDSQQRMEDGFYVGEPRWIREAGHEVSS